MKALSGARIEAAMESGETEHEPETSRYRRGAEDAELRGTEQHGIGESQPGDEAGHRKTDARDAPDERDAAPADAARQGADAEADRDEADDEDAEWLAQHEADGDRNRHILCRCTFEADAVEADAGVG